MKPLADYIVHSGVKGRSGKKGAGLWYKNNELTEEGKRHYYGESYGKRKNSKREELNSLVKTKPKQTESKTSSRNASDSKVDKMISDSGLDKRITGMDRKVFSMYSRSTQKKILSYMKKNPKMSFEQADRKETRSTLVRGLAGALAFTGASYVLLRSADKMASKELKKIASSQIDKQASTTVQAIRKSPSKTSICMSGSEYIDMVLGRDQWGKWIDD